MISFIKFYKFIIISISITIWFKLLSSTPINSEDIEKEYNDYYEQRIRAITESDTIVEESEITLWTVFKPFFLTFFGTIVAIVICLISFFCFCLILSIDWNSCFTLLEYCPCVSQSRQKQQFEALRVAGVYRNPFGKDVLYEATDQEKRLIEDIGNRLKD